MPDSLWATEPAPKAVIAALEAELRPTWWITGAEPQPETLNQRMLVHQTPALSVAVIADGEIEWTHAWGMADVAAKLPASSDTLFQAASISKLFAAMTALSLVEDGSLSLDGDVNDQLKRWKLPESAFSTEQPVSVRLILGHRAGLSVWGFEGYGPGAEIPDAVALLDGSGNSDPVRLFQPPGQGWRYSGGGYQILQVLMEDVSKQGFAELVRQRVLKPLKMRSSSYAQPLSAEQRKRAAVGYESLLQPVAGGAHVYPELAAAGLWTTPADLARFVIAVQQMNAGERGEPLSRERTQSMLTRGDGGHGLGPQLSDDGLRFQHGGSNAGFRCFLFGSLDGRYGAVLMTNGDGGAKLYGEVLHALARQYGWPGFDPEVKSPIRMSADALGVFAGRYQVPDIGVLTLRAGDDALIATSTFFAGETTLLPEGPTRFFDKGNRQGFEFELDQGKVIAVSIAGRIRALREVQ
ncbi:MAG: serine hydrolase [Xanthomonadales bacterium]|nr:serine hydrolase [Xanthomonadales bacterium]